MNYNYFDYKKNIVGYSGQDMFSTAHILVMSVMFITLIVLCIAFKKARKKNISIFLKVLSCVLPILEIARTVWETVWDIRFGVGFNYSGNLPFYTCSLFLFVLPLAAFSKGKAKKYALSFITTLGISAGLTNFIYLNILRTYPLFTFSATYSLLFHFLMVFTGVFLIVTDYYRPAWRDLLYGLIPLWIFSLIVIPTNYIVINYGETVDYMLYMHGAWMPVIGPMSDFFRRHEMPMIFTLFMATIGYGTFNLFTVSLEQLIFKLFCNRGTSENGKRNTYQN